MSLEIKHVQIKNYKSIGYVKLDLENLGVVGVIGRNLDRGGSNGAAKSSIVCAMHWCLFGDPIRSLPTVKDVIRQGSEECSVKMTMMIHDHSVTVQRTRSNTTKEVSLFIDGENRSAQSKDAITNARIIEAIGMSKQHFQSAVIYGHSVPRFSMTDDRSRKDLILDMAGINYRDTAAKIATYYKISSDRKNNLHSRVEHARRDIDVIRAKIVEGRRLYREIIEQYEAKKRSLLNRLNALSDEQSELLEFKEEYLQKFKNTDVYKKETEEVYLKLRSAVTLLDKEILALSKEDKSVEDAMNKPYGAMCPICGSVLDGAGLTKLQDKRKSLKKEISKLYVERSDTYRDMEQVANEKNSASALMLTLKNKLDTCTNKIHSIEIQKARINGELEAKVSIDYQDWATQLEYLECVVKYQSRKLLLQEAIEDFKNATVLKIMYQKDELPAYSVSKLIPGINSYINKYISILSGGDISAELSISEQSLKITARSSTGGDQYPKFSDGERGRVDISLFMAMHDVLSYKYGAVEFMFIDEALDVIDQQGAESLVELLQMKADAVGTILIVSHRSDILQSLPVHMIVTKRNGISEVTT